MGSIAQETEELNQQTLKHTAVGYSFHSQTNGINPQEWKVVECTNEQHQKALHKVEDDATKTFQNKYSLAQHKC